MNDFLNSFVTYYRNAPFNTFTFWAFPLITFGVIWLSVVITPKLYRKRGKLTNLFVINRIWIVSALVVAGILISIICFWWAKNIFAKNHLQLALLISLFVAMLVPILAMLNLRGYFSQANIKEIVEQPKTINQLNNAVAVSKKAYNKNKLFYFLPIIGFAFLLFYINKGTNLISIIFDNSESMQQTSGTDALTETFNTLDKNNEIIFATIEGYTSADLPPVLKTNLQDIMAVTKSSKLKAGNIVAYNNPYDAISGLNQISNQCLGSPICEVIWKTYLSIAESKANQKYEKRILILITDGVDNAVTNTVAIGKFFFDDEKFTEMFPPDNVFLIDYSNGNSNALIQRFQNAGCDIYPAENSKQAYLDALDNALQSFKNNGSLIVWTIVIFGVLTLLGIIIQPKKII